MVVAFPLRAPLSIRLRRLAFVAGVGVWLGALAVALWWHGLPIMLDAGLFTPFSRYVSLPLCGLLAVLGAVGPPTQRRSHVMLDVCLRVACAMMATDLYLTDVGRGLYTVGWYASRVAEVLALSGTLGVLMWQAAGSYARTRPAREPFSGRSAARRAHRNREPALLRSRVRATLVGGVGDARSQRRLRGRRSIQIVQRPVRPCGR